MSHVDDALLDEAKRHLEEALGIAARANARRRVAEPTDGFETKAGAYEWLARTLALVGKPREAREAAATAVEIYEAKGDVAAIAWSRDLLDSLSG